MCQQSEQYSVCPMLLKQLIKLKIKQIIIQRFFILVFSIFFVINCDLFEQETPNPMEGTWHLEQTGLYENIDCSGDIDFETSFYSYWQFPGFTISDTHDDDD